jgi:hypothetical protein
MLSNNLNSKHIVLMIVITSATLLNTSCNNTEKEKRECDLQDFKAYVKEHRNATEQYAQDSWEDLNSGFEKKKAELGKQADKMDDKAITKQNLNTLLLKL